jgi:hypothetical protein
MCDYLPETADLGFIAIGWLEPKQSYAIGEVDDAFFDKLCDLLASPWRPPAVCCGEHPCGLCRFTGGGRTFRKGTTVNARSCGFLFVPFETTIFVTPYSIAHYIDAHGYRPPDIFRQAVMSCPNANSIEFKRALLGTPVKQWLRRRFDAPAGDLHG